MQFFSSARGRQLCLVLLLCGRASSRQIPATAGSCQTDADCLLNGKCSTGTQESTAHYSRGTCVCGSGWTGPHCGQFDFLPTPPGPLGGKAYPNDPNSSTWGSSVVKGPDDMYHMYTSGILGNCGLKMWGANAALTHAVSANLEGPYVAKDIVMRASNPQITQFEGEFRLWHIMGGGDWGPSTPGYCHLCTNGSTPTACENTSSETADRRLSGDGSAPQSQNLVVAKSPEGPWVNLPITCEGWGTGTRATDCPSIQNPTAYYYPNGTTMLMYDWQFAGAPKGFFLAIAPTVSGPYRPLSGNWNVTSITWPQDMGCTDPFLWRDPSGHFHAVFHCRDWNTGGPSAGDAGGHAYSADGVSWVVAQEPAWTLTVDHTDGTNTTFFHRERPQVFIDPDTGAPAALFNAVSLANLNQPFPWQAHCPPRPSHVQIGCDQSMAFVQHIRTH